MKPVLSWCLVHYDFQKSCVDWLRTALASCSIYGSRGAVYLEGSYSIPRWRSLWPIICGRGGTWWTYVYRLGWVVARISCCGASSRKQSRERSDENNLCHLKLSIAQRSILEQSDLGLSQSRRHDPIHPKQEAGAEDHVVQNNFFDQAEDFAE